MTWKVAFGDGLRRRQGRCRRASWGKLQEALGWRSACAITPASARAGVCCRYPDVIARLLPQIILRRLVDTETPTASPHRLLLPQSMIVSMIVCLGRSCRRPAVQAL